MKTGKDIENKISRLSKMLGTDEGFYLLSLHSFIEYYLRYIRGYGEDLNFPELTWMFREELLDNNEDTFIEGLSSLGQLGRQHSLTNRVRHSFEEIGREEARSGTHLFIRFCMLAGIYYSDSFSCFQTYLDAWKDRSAIKNQNDAIIKLENRLSELQKKNIYLTDQLEEYNSLKNRISELEFRINWKNIEIEKANLKIRNRNDKLDQLRNQRFNLVREKNSLLEYRDKYTDLEKYLEYMGRLTLYTRSRFDFEKSLSELTPEQRETADSVNLDTGCLIRGSAGTGKSLVLAEALRQSLVQKDLDLFDDNKTLFVTFTRNLVKYNKYVSRVMGMNIPDNAFCTADTFILDKLKEINPQIEYNFSLAETFFRSEEIPDFIGREELIAEIDDFLFGHAVGKEEYIGEKVKRDGLKSRLPPQKREIIWEKRNMFADYMDKKSLFTINYGRYCLYRHLVSLPESKRKMLRHVFIDEVQDLNPAALLVFRHMATGSLVMAGDFDQTLYMTAPPFARAGIDTRGITRVLKTNFRNTRQITELAERFKSLNQAGKADRQQVVSFREGPEPELFKAEDAAGMEKQLTARVNLYIRELGYDPGNICILVPRNTTIDRLTALLEEELLSVLKINSPDFSFHESGSISIATFHSGKGLDFPVILAFIPELHRLKKYSDAYEEQLSRNLIYTGITRAMDHLNVFVHETENIDPVLSDLVSCFR